MSALVNGVMKRVASLYQGQVTGTMNTYGLKYEDCLISTPEVTEVMSYAPADLVMSRDRRMKRAMDLSFKKKDLKDYAPQLVSAARPMQLEFIAEVEEVRKRDEERILLNKGW